MIMYPFQVFEGNTPWPGKAFTVISNIIKKHGGHEALHKPVDMNDNLWQVVKALFSHNPASPRPTIQEIIQELRRLL
jgi:hypothetical protein